MNSSIAILIPAYEPQDPLVEVVRELRRNFSNIVVVDDGSFGGKSLEALNEIDRFGDVLLFRHATNLGKGAALKSGMNLIYTTLPNCEGIITVDADGQHRPDDVCKIAEEWSNEKHKLILGSRQFEGYVPARSRFGNWMTRKVFQILTGLKIHDTQTGLRAFHRSMVPKLLKIPQNGYDLEMEMLLGSQQSRIEIAEVPIRTVYEKDNPSSHFNPLLDSMKIYFLILRFGFSSFLGAVLDYILFGIFVGLSGNIAFSQITARTIAAPVNFMLNKEFVFHSTANPYSAFAKYALLVVLNCLVAFFIINEMVTSSGVHVMLAKMGAEALLFLVNYVIQKELVFKRA
jgi:putative flippase GtrA